MIHDLCWYFFIAWLRVSVCSKRSCIDMLSQYRTQWKKTLIYILRDTGNLSHTPGIRTDVLSWMHVKQLQWPPQGRNARPSAVFGSEKDFAKIAYAYVLKAPNRNQPHVRVFCGYHYLREMPLNRSRWANTLYPDGHVTAIFARKMTRTYSDVNLVPL